MVLGEEITIVFGFLSVEGNWACVWKVDYNHRGKIARYVVNIKFAGEKITTRKDISKNVL